MTKLWLSSSKVVWDGTNPTDCAACPCGPTPGADCTNCSTGTSPLNMTVDPTGAFTNGTGTCCTTLTNQICVQDGGNPCLWTGPLVNCGAAGNIDFTVTITFNGSNYFLNVITSANSNLTWQKDLGTSAPNCSGFSSLAVPFLSAGIGGDTLCTHTGSDIHVTSGP